MPLLACSCSKLGSAAPYIMHQEGAKTLSSGQSRLLKRP